MSAFEISYIVFAVIVFFGAMVLEDFTGWFLLNLSVVAIAGGLIVYSSENSPSYETHSQPAQILSQFEVPSGMLVYYLDFNGKSQRAEYTQYEDVQKLKNGGVLHLTSNYGWVNFGPDKETIEVKIK